MAQFEFNNNIYISKIDEKKDSTIISKKTINFQKPIILKFNTKNKELSIDAYTDNEYDAKYIEGLVNYEYPIYINIKNTKYGKFYGILKSIDISREQAGFYEIKLDVERINSDYCYNIISDKQWIENDFVDESSIIPTIILPKDTEVIYNGILPETIGDYDIYETDYLELSKPIPTTQIKIYDTLGKSDENLWKLISNPEEHDFIGNIVIEYCNIRLIGRRIYIKIDDNWVYVGILYIETPGGNNDLFDTTMKINYKKLNNLIIKYKITNKQYIYTNLNCDSGAIYTNEPLEITSKILPTEIYCNEKGSIYINSDFDIKTGGCENDYTLTSGSNGWLLRIGINYKEPFVLFSKSQNIKYSNNDGSINTNGKWINYCLFNYIKKLFNEAENGNIINGIISTDTNASNNNVVQGTGDTLNIDIINTKIEPEMKLPNGKYKVLFRIKVSDISTNDLINIGIYDIDNNITIIEEPRSANYIGTTYSYHILDWDYDGSYNYSISIKPNANVDSSIFYVDYVAIIPINKIEKIQRRIFCKNNQRLEIIPR